MTRAKRSADRRPDPVREIEPRAGERELSLPFESASAQARQPDRLVELERALAKICGPIPDEVQARVERLPWPK